MTTNELGNESAIPARPLAGTSHRFSKRKARNAMRFGDLAG